MIIADTGAILSLLNSNDQYHGVMLEIFEADPRMWVLPWAILPEVDYMLWTRLGHKIQTDFFAEIANGEWSIDRGTQHDLTRAYAFHAKFQIGLVDGVVIATAERLGAEAIATIDVRHFGKIPIRGNPKLLPRDF